MREIQAADTTLEVHTNAGTRLVTQQGKLDKFGTVWFNQEAIVNVLSFAEVEDHPDYRVGYHEEQKAFKVLHKPTIKLLSFTRHGGHYIYCPPSSCQPQPICDNPNPSPTLQLYQTVKDNMKNFTVQQIQQAQKAKDLIYSLGVPNTRPQAHPTNQHDQGLPHHGAGPQECYPNLRT